MAEETRWYSLRVISGKERVIKDNRKNKEFNFHYKSPLINAESFYFIRLKFQFGNKNVGNQLKKNTKQIKSVSCCFALNSWYFNELIQIAGANKPIRQQRLGMNRLLVCL